MDCSTCKERKTQAEPVPFQVHQADMARMERSNVRLWIVIIILLVALIASNAGWIYYESQFETVVTTQEVWQDAEDGDNQFIGGDFYGKAESDNDHGDADP